MRSLYSLSWRNLAARRLRSVLTGAAIALGVAAVFAASVIGYTAQLRAAELARQVSRADLQITPLEDDALDARLLDLVRAQPDVAQVSPEIVHPAVLAEPPGVPLILLGIDPQAYAQIDDPQIAQGRYLASAYKTWIVVPERWADENRVGIGGVLRVPVDGAAPLELKVVGLLKHRDEASAMLADRTALVPLVALQDALGMRRRLTRIRVSLLPDRDLTAVEAKLTAALPPDAGALVSPVDAGSSSRILYVMMEASLGLAGGVILLAGALLIANTFAMSVTERTRHIGILRSLGLTRRGVQRVVLAEAAALGICGALLGLPVGWALAQAIVALLAAWQGIAWDHLSVPPAALVGAPSAGAMVAVVAAWWPAQRAALVHPLAAIQPHRDDHARPGPSRARWAGVALLAAVGGASAWMLLVPAARALEFATMMLACNTAALFALVGGVLLLPQVIAALVAAGSGLLSRSGVVARLAGDQLARERNRTTLTAGTLAVGVATVVMLSGVMGTVLQGTRDIVLGLMHEDYGILPLAAGRSLEDADPLSWQKDWPRSVVAALDAERARAYVYGLSFSGPAEGIEPVPGTGVFALDDPEAFLRAGSFRYEQGDLETALRIIRRGRAILATPALARRYGVGVGDDLVLDTRRGRAVFHIAAVGGNPWWGSIISRADAETYFGVHPPIGYFVEPKPGVDSAGVGVRLRAALRAEPGYQLLELASFGDLLDNSVGRVLAVLGALLDGLTLLAIVIAALGQINTMTASVIERLRELSILRSLGMLRQQLRGLVLIEAAVIGAAGAAAGALVGAVAALAYQVLFFGVAVEAMGFGAPTAASVGVGIARGLGDAAWPALFGLLLAPPVTVLAAWLPARMAANASIIETIRDL